LPKKIGVDEVKFKSAQVYEYENGNELIPTNEKYSRYRKTAEGKYETKNKLLNHCWKLWQSCVFTWDGKVVPCCFDKDASHTMGDIAQTGFKELWQGESYKAFRSAVLRSRKEIDICQNCTEGTAVWV
jgi:radical SAM protein with 4Fe4S-binding SPASM domain